MNINEACIIAIIGRRWGTRYEEARRLLSVEVAKIVEGLDAADELEAARQAASAAKEIFVRLTDAAQPVPEYFSEDTPYNPPYSGPAVEPAPVVEEFPVDRTPE